MSFAQAQTLITARPLVRKCTKRIARQSINASSHCVVAIWREEFERIFSHWKQHFFLAVHFFLKENAKILQDLFESILMDPRSFSCQEHASGCLYLCDEECLCYKDVQWTDCKEENVCAQEQTWMIARSPRQKCTEQTFTKRESEDVQICITLCKLQFEGRNSQEFSANDSILFLISIFSEKERKSFKTFLNHS